MARPFRAMRWLPAVPDPVACYLIARETGLSPVTAQVLYNRGLTTPEAAVRFLTASRDQLIDPFRLKDMDKAVHLIRERIASGRPIMVYGDYDADGVTGTSVLVLALRALGAQVDYYIPNRFGEGYGLNVPALQEIYQRGYDFVLSVDTGITALPEAEAARAMGMTLVISDHHEPGPALPEVGALVNPKRPDCTYPFKGLSGVGVAFKLALALEAPNAWDLLDIVTLGTIADMVPLVDENRAIVREGLAALGSTRRPGLRALMEVAGVREPVTATHIGFALGPRINALGRMGSAMQGVELLLTEDSAQARSLAMHLDEQNRNRQEVEAGIFQEAMAQANAQPPEEREHVLVLAGEGWHHGVVGICASRVLDAFYRPTILLSVDGEEVRGSARSIPAFHMQRALLQVSDLFTKFGGHAAAAGMTLKNPADVPVLRQRLNAIGARWLRPEDLVPELRVDAEVGISQVNDALLEELRRLEPHGVGNPQPVFAARGVDAVDSRMIGKEGQHLKLAVRSQGVPFPMDAVGWNMAPATPSTPSKVALAFYPETETYQGRTKTRLTMRDVQVEGQPKRGNPVNVVERPALTAEECLAWDPLGPAGQRPNLDPRLVTDLRGERLAQFQSAPADPEAAATAEAEDGHAEPETGPEPYVAGLVAGEGARVLVLTASPWSAAALAVRLGDRYPDLRGRVALWRPGSQEPQEAALVVAAHGQPATGRYTDTVWYHPPYNGGQSFSGRLHLLWQPEDWQLTEAALGWAYPDRDLLIILYKLLKAGTASSETLAQALSEMPGPWNTVRYQSALSVFREVGLTTNDGRLVATAAGAKFDLEASERYRRGTQARTLLAEFAAGDWPGLRNAI